MSKIKSLEREIAEVKTHKNAMLLRLLDSWEDVDICIQHPFYIALEKEEKELEQKLAELILLDEQTR